MSLHIELASLLMDVEAELRTLELWEAEHPGEEALASTEPFCVDTLAFHQWLQFVFIPRMNFLVENEGLLPNRCEIVPMAEEFYRGGGLAISELLTALQRIDELLSSQS